MQKLLRTDQVRILNANWRENEARTNRGENTIDHRPVVKLFTPWANATWLFSELDPGDGDRLYGLCDTGQGSPELGYASLAEIAALRGPAGLRVERDLHVRLDKPISFYAELARRSQRIVV